MCQVFAQRVTYCTVHTLHNSYTSISVLLNLIPRHSKSWRECLVHTHAQRIHCDIYYSAWGDQRHRMGSYMAYTPHSCDCREYIAESGVYILWLQGVYCWVRGVYFVTAGSILLDCRDVLGVLWWPKRTSTISHPEGGAWGTYLPAGWNPNHWRNF